MNGNGKPANAETQLQVAIGSFLISVADKNSAVSRTVYTSLKKLAEKHSNQILNSCCQFCKRDPKHNDEHIALVLEIMETICQDFITDIDGDTVLLVIDFSLQIMIETAGYEPLVQMPASGILVAVGREHYIQVMDALLKNLQAGIVPHYMIPHTLGSLANANAYGVVPYLKNILNIILPLLNTLRTDPLKQAFSYALGSFCEALTEYVSNINQVPDNTITIEDFNVEIGVAFDVLFSSWLFSREPKVADTVLNAVTAIYPLMSAEKVNQHTTKTIQVLLSLYKRQVSAYNVTRCLGAVIKKTADVNGTLLEPILSSILNSLSDLICTSPDYAQPELLRSHSEVLRCYECFALHFTDHTIDLLITQMFNNNRKERIKALLIITHLISYSKEQSINRRLKDILKNLNEIINDPNIRVKKAVVKIIVAFALKGLLVNKDINPFGPEKYLTFILKMCCKQVPPKDNSIDAQEILDIQKTADNTLYMLCTSVPELEDSLWHLMINNFLGPAYDDAVVIILRCLTHLASKKERVQSCEAAFIRCLGLLALPLPEFRGNYILNFLKNIKPCDDESYKTVWDSQIPHLTKYLEQNYENLNSVEWQHLLFDFLNLLLDSVKNEAFYEILVFKTREQFLIYNNNRNSGNGSDATVKQIEKQFLLKCLAVILCYTNDKDTVLQTLDNILVNVKLTDFSELHTCAEAVGICARTHLETVLDKLALIRKEVLVKKSTKFLQFSFIKDQKNDLGIERFRYVVINSYAEVCNEAPSDKLLRIIESEILDFVVNELNITKDFQIKRVCIRAICSIANAMHPNRNKLHIRMRDRDKVLQLISSQVHLHSGPEYIELFPDIIPALTSLCRLPVPLESDERLNLLKLVFDNVFNASAIYCKINSESSDSYFGTLKLVPYVTKSFTELNQLVQEILMQSISPATLDEVVTLLEPWLLRKKPEQRLPASETLRLVLQTYLDNMKFAYDCPTSFGQTGSLLAYIIPRCTDPNTHIRKVAVECLCLVLCIAGRYEGHMRDHDKKLSDSLEHIQQQIESDDPKLLYNLTADIAHIISINMPQFQLLHFVEGLVDSLLDSASSSSNGSAVVLQLILKNKGPDLHSHVTSVLEKMLVQLDKICCPNTKSQTLKAILNLSTHYPKVVCGVLTAQQIPFSSSVCDCWAILSTDNNLMVELLEYCKKVLKHTPHYEEQGNGEVKVATLQTLQVICVFNEIFKHSNQTVICKNNFAELFTLFLITIGSYIGTTAPVGKSVGDRKEKYGFILNRDAYKLYPTKMVLDAFRLYLTSCQFNKMASNLLTFNHLGINEENELFLKLISTLVQDICEEYSECLMWLVEILGPYIRAEVEFQRLAAVAFFAYLLKEKANETPVLGESLLEMILDVQMDYSCIVRQTALKGLGYAAECLNHRMISTHCNPILSVLMNSLDYNNIGNESLVILEGMLSFSKLINALKNYKFSSFQVTAAVRIKPLLVQDDLSLRQASVRLLGDLTLSLNPDSNLEAFKEQIQGNLVTLLLHLCDPEPEVIKTCKYTLRQVSTYLESPKVNDMVQEHLIDEANLQYPDFIRDLVKVMADELQELFPLFIMTSLSYLKSQWVTIRSNAALLTGLLYSNLSTENRTRVSLDTICDRLMRLLTDEYEDVRMRAVQAIAYLFL